MCQKQMKLMISFIAYFHIYPSVFHIRRACNIFLGMGPSTRVLVCTSSTRVSFGTWVIGKKYQQIVFLVFIKLKFILFHPLKSSRVIRHVLTVLLTVSPLGGYQYWHLTPIKGPLFLLIAPNSNFILNTLILHTLELIHVSRGDRRNSLGTG